MYMPVREIILGFSILASFSITYPVVKSARKDIVSYMFLILIICMGAWLAASYSVDIIKDPDLSINHTMAVLASIFGGLSIVLCSGLTTLLAKIKIGRTSKALFLIGILLVVVGSLLPGSIASVQRESPQLVSVQYGVLNNLWVIGVAMGLGLLIRAIMLSIGSKAKNPKLMRIVTLGVLGGVIFGLTTNYILPIASGSYSSVKFAPLVAVILSTSFSYAISAHRLFDLRSSVFRALAYTLSIVTLILIYSVIIYGVLLPVVYPGTRFEITGLLLITVGTATSIFFFDKIKTVFDAITDRLFFKNSYNLPKFLDDFNQALINSSDVGELAKSIFKVMGDTLKTEFFLLVIKHDKFEITIDSRRKESIREVDAKAPLSLIHYHLKSGDRVVLSDYLNKEKYEGLYEILDKADASAAIDLSESSKTTGSLRKALESGNFKAMLLGPKRSGESYNAQDLDALRIISKELVVGLQNAMRFEEIKLFNLELQHKVDLATGKLREQNKKLVVADELKDDFLSIASHQMRTPISAINGYASILNSGDAGKLNKNQQKFAKIIEDSTKRLSYLINDFLTVSRLKSGKFSIEKTDTDLNKVLKSEVSNLTAQFKAKGVSLKVNIDESLPIIKADESKIRQVMMNLIDNALYYTPAEGEVNVSLKKATSGIIFEVKDSGIGVPKDDQSKLFSKMFRAGNAQKMRPDGTGLGLYLAKKVILGHHGHIIFNSVENEGSTFGFKIPTK